MNLHANTQAVVCMCIVSSPNPHDRPRAAYTTTFKISGPPNFNMKFYNHPWWEVLLICFHFNSSSMGIVSQEPCSAWRQKLYQYIPLPICPYCTLQGASCTIYCPSLRKWPTHYFTNTSQYLTLAMAEISSRVPEQNKASKIHDSNYIIECCYITSSKSRN